MTTTAADPITSDLGIVNLALARLGINPILDFDEQSAPANLARAQFDQARNDMLSRHPWNFATKTASVALDTLPTGEWDFAYAYARPNDCLRVVEVEDEANVEGYNWKVEDELILTDLGTGTALKIRYIWQNRSVGTYSPGFIDTLAAKLEADWSEHLVKSTSQGERKDRAFDRAQQSSATRDSLEGRPIVTGRFETIDVR